MNGRGEPVGDGGGLGRNEYYLSIHFRDLRVRARWWCLCVHECMLHRVAGVVSGTGRACVFVYGNVPMVCLTWPLLAMLTELTHTNLPCPNGDGSVGIHCQFMCDPGQRQWLVGWMVCLRMAVPECVFIHSFAQSIALANGNSPSPCSDSFRTRAKTEMVLWCQVKQVCNIVVACLHGPDDVFG